MFKKEKKTDRLPLTWTVLDLTVLPQPPTGWNYQCVPLVTCSQHYMLAIVWIFIPAACGKLLGTFYFLDRITILFLNEKNLFFLARV